MIYSLGEPVFFAGLLLGFLLGCFVHVAVQRWVTLRFGGAGARWLLPSHAGAGRYLDPYGAVAVLLGGVGWPTPLEAASYRRANRGRVIALILSGPIANAALSAACLAVLARVGGFGALLGSPSVGDVLRGHLDLSSAGPTLLVAIALMNMNMAVLSLVPLPPLDGARIMFLLAPRSIGWQKAEYHLAERNIGVVILLVGLILPIGAYGPPIGYVVSSIAQPIVQALLSAFGA